MAYSGIQLPQELINKIMFTMGGLQHPTAKSMKSIIDQYEYGGTNVRQNVDIKEIISNEEGWYGGDWVGEARERHSAFTFNAFFNMGKAGLRQH